MVVKHIFDDGSGSKAGKVPSGTSSRKGGAPKGAGEEEEE